MNRIEMKRLLVLLALLISIDNLQGQNIGINNSIPRYPVSFNTASGDKISLFDDGNPAGIHFGLGVQSGALLQVFAATSNDAIAFGTGKSNAFTELVRIKGNGNTGIGTSIPLARLHVSDSNVLFSGPVSIPVTTSFAPPVQGPGVRMMWYPQKAAFRAGYADGSQWDKNFIGRYSFATGFSTIANGMISTSMGYLTNSSGDMSTAMGYNTIAAGTYSTAMGNNSIATGSNSIAMGSLTTASGFASLTMGEFLYAKARSATTIGMYNDYADSPDPNTEQPDDRIFQIGNGSFFGGSRNAITVLRNGNTGIGTVNPIRPLSFPASLGEKILLYPGGAGEVGIGVYGNELRLHCDNPGSKVSFGTQTNAGVFTELAKAEANGVFAFSIFGSLWVNGATYSSDERFKQNITPISFPLEKLLQLNGVEYEMKTTAFAKNHFQHGRQMGLLAQEVEKVVPEAVSEMDGYKGVDYARLVPLLIESIKELKKEIEELKKKR